MGKPPFNVQLIDAITPQVWASGYRMLQTHQYGNGDDEHTRILLEHLDPPRDGVVVDMGSGFGETARRMRELRPDILWMLVNLSEKQHTYAHQLLGEERVVYLLADAHATGLTADSIDAVMFNSSLVQMDEALALREAHRILRPGGRLLVNELTRNPNVTDGSEMEARLACRCLPWDQLLRAIGAAGFEGRHLTPMRDFSMKHFETLLALAKLEHLTAGLSPVIVTAIKPAS